MDKEHLRKISEKYLLPLFSGAKIKNNGIAATPRKRIVSLINPQEIAFSVDENDNYRLVIKRDQPFEKIGAPAPEIEVIRAFINKLRHLNAGDFHPSLEDDFLASFQRRFIAEAVADGIGEEIVLAVIDQMTLWATRLYEGNPISSAIGLTQSLHPGSNVSLSDIAKNDFGSVLSNGFDTILEFDADLNLLRYSDLSNNVIAPGITQTQLYYPMRQAAIANWTTHNANKIAIILNRLGEILIFRQGHLLFARRSGDWHFLTHEPIIRQMKVPNDKGIRQAIYETALDASFARTGACIGVVSSKSLRASGWKGTIADTDLLSEKKCIKTAAIATTINGKKFHRLNRALRQELVAIDGATVIDFNGNVLAVGAILNIPGGSTGGGRTAAARKLGGFGLGLKISQDGRISGYRQNNKMAFRIM